MTQTPISPRARKDLKRTKKTKKTRRKRARVRVRPKTAISYLEKLQMLSNARKLKSIILTRIPPSRPPRKNPKAKKQPKKGSDKTLIL